ncbi:YjbH domain-containing protein [Gammaproteobacteria bacterium]|nr:YjbH domain-containing protein [Gammaproteobacteria bacterium]
MSFDVCSSLNDYIYPNSQPSYSNYGTIGLIQMPTARALPEGTIAFTWTDNKPYKRGSILAYPFEWFEASYQYTDMENALYSSVIEFSGTQTYKDKSFDAKFILLEETRNYPALAVGLRDLAGSGYFSSEYLVASKKLNNIDYTLGLGWGYLGEDFTNPLIKLNERFRNRTLEGDTAGGEFNPGTYFSGPMGVFAGLEAVIPNAKGLRVKIEYDATNYDKEGFSDPSNPFFLYEIEQPKTRINYGLVYPVNNSFQVKLGYTKGNTISFGFSLSANFTKKNSIIKMNDPHEPIPNAHLWKRAASVEPRNTYRIALSQMGERKFYLQTASISDDEKEFDVTYTQSKYISAGRATGRIARTLDSVLPDSIETINITNLNANAAMSSVEIPRAAIARYEPGNNTDLLKREVKINEKKFTRNQYKYVPDDALPKNLSKITPSIRSQVGGPDGFYFGELAIAYHSELVIRKDLTLSTVATIGLYDTFDGLKLASDSVLPHVRTDIVQYLKNSRKGHIRHSSLTWFKQPYKNLYAKFTGGILEEMFSGIGGEFLYRDSFSNFGIGAELWWVKQRDYRMLFQLRDYKTVTGHINLFYQEPRSNIVVSLKGGRFLAKDSGINVDIARKWPSGLRLGVFFAKTDISEQEFGEGSFDKGFYFNVPIESLFGTYQRGLTPFGLRPIQRDGAAALNVQFPLWGVTDWKSSSAIFDTWDDFYD